MPPVFSERYFPHVHGPTLTTPTGSASSYDRPDYAGQSFFTDDARIVQMAVDVLRKLDDATVDAMRSDPHPAPSCRPLRLPDAAGNVAPRGDTCCVYVGNAGILLALTRVLQQYDQRARGSGAGPQDGGADDDDGVASLAERLLLRILPYVEGEARVWQNRRSSSSSGGGAGFYMGPMGTHLVLLDAAATLATVATRRGRPVHDDSAAPPPSQPPGASHIAAVVHHAKDVLSQLEGEDDRTTSSAVASEHLYGVAGTIYALQFLLSVVSEHQTLYGAFVSVEELHGLVGRLAHGLIRRGAVEAERHDGHRRMPLLWLWHGTPYLGAAHGATGILTQLLDVWEWLSSDDDRRLVVQSVDALVALTVRRGGFLPTAWPDAIDDDDENDGSIKVHWCHGTPGVVMMCVAAFRATGAQQYLGVAETLVDRVVYPFGALRKGAGLCHGLSGNAYVFLAMYRATRRPKFLYYANRYLHILSSQEYAASTHSYRDPQRVVPNAPDAPWSLMEGIAGTLCFLSDLRAPECSAFPGFEARWGDRVVWSDVRWRSLSQRHGVVPRGAALSGPHGDGLLVPLSLHRLVCRCLPLSDDTAFPVVRCPGMFTAAQCEALRTAISNSVTSDALRAAPVRVQSSVFGPLLTDLTHFVQQVVDRHPDMAMAPPLPSSRGIVATLTQRAVYGTNHVWSTSWWEPERRGSGRKRLFATRAYVVRYDTQHHEQLRSHVDASHVTLNVCLFSDCAPDGGNLVFEAPALTSYHHRIGEGLVHRGDIHHHTHVLRAPTPAAVWRFAKKAQDVHRVQLVVLFEFEQDDTPLVKALYASTAPLCDALTTLPETVLGEVSLFLPLRDVAKLLACGSRAWQRILEPRVGGLPATMLWRERAVCTPRIAQWLPTVWPEYFSPARPGYRPAMAGRSYDEALMRRRPFAPLIREVRSASGIDRETSQRVAAAAGAGGCPPAKDAAPTHRAQGVRFDPASLEDAQRGPCYSMALSAHVDWTDVDECIDWKAVVQHTLHFANTMRPLLRHPNDDDDTTRFGDDDDDTMDSTGSSYTTPEVETALRALAARSRDGNMSDCYRCAEVMEAHMDRLARPGGRSSDNQTPSSTTTSSSD